MTKILAINHNYLCDPRLDTVLNTIDPLDRKMLTYFCTSSGATEFGLMSRAGTNIFPFCNDILPMIDSCMPDYCAGFNLTWEEITDQRAKEIEQLILQGKQLVIFWSGGIDSTCMVTAVLKNFHKANLSQVIIACTWDGVIENPVFYHDFILPNFRTVDTNQFINNDMKTDPNLIVVEGFGADTLTTCVNPSIDRYMSVRNGKLLTRSWRQPDQLLQGLEQISGSKEFAKWYYEKNCQSIASINIPIETYFDFLWWIGFDCEYYVWALHAWFFCYQHLDIPYHEFKGRCIGWYRNNNYQQWAMNNNGPNVKHGLTLGSFKKHVKKYIYDYDKNEFYWRYKTKIISKGRKYNNSDQKPFAITDNFEILHLEKNLNQIIDFLPTHFVIQNQLDIVS